jgi:hypothetical protein
MAWRVILLTERIAVKAGPAATPRREVVCPRAGE